MQRHQHDVHHGMFSWILGSSNVVLQKDGKTSMNRASKQQQSRKENGNGKNIYTQNQEAIAGISWTRN